MAAFNDLTLLESIKTQLDASIDNTKITGYHLHFPPESNASPYGVLYVSSSSSIVEDIVFGGDEETNVHVEIHSVFNDHGESQRQKSIERLYNAAEFVCGQLSPARFYETLQTELASNTLRRSGLRREYDIISIGENRHLTCTVTVPIVSYG